MKAEELMIGDWVKRKDDNKPCKVDGIISTDDACLLSTTNDNLGFDYMFDPIPLTEEILKKNGGIISDTLAKFDIGNYYIIFEYDGFLTICEDNYNERKISYINCDYVHQLQHALRLCGINKEIVL